MNTFLTILGAIGIIAIYAALEGYMNHLRDERYRK
jgi:hypothetical protein